MRLVVGESSHVATPSSNRVFGLFCSFVLTLLALLSVLKSMIVLASILQVLALVFFLVSLKAESKLRVLNLGWVKFGVILGKITNPLILTFIFFIVVIPYATIGRLLRRDSLQLKARNQKDTTWTIRDRESHNLEWLRRQF